MLKEKALFAGSPGNWRSAVYRRELFLNVGRIPVRELLKGEINMRYFIYFTIWLFAVAVSVSVISHKRMVQSQKYGDSLQSCLYLQKELIDSQEKYIDGMEKVLNRNRSVTVTAYTASEVECDTEPDMTASMKRAKAGTVAVSRDLFNTGWVFGSKVYIEGHGMFEIVDLMNKKHRNCIDVFMGTPDEARQFGIKQVMATLLLS